jgi:hypothetical protein
MGASGIIDVILKSNEDDSLFEKITIGGISGIESKWNFQKGMYECIPYS